MIAALTTSVPVAWLVARAAGLVAFGLFTAAVLLGLALSTRLLGNKRSKQLLAWHQTIMWTAIGMVLLHIVALLLDPVMHFRVVDVLVPGVARWRPIPVAAGVVTLWLMVALAVSFRLRRQIGQRRWRLLHYASFGGFFGGLYHALNVGSDLTGGRGLVFTGVLCAPALWLMFARILMPRPRGAKTPTQDAPQRAPARPTAAVM
jgi:hypothetical protein